MGLQTRITISCDFPGCKETVSWIKEDVESGKIIAPAASMYLVMFNQGGSLRCFCGQYHAAMYFMPPGYDVKKKKVESITRGPVPEEPQESPENGQCECGHPLDQHSEWGCCVERSDRMGDFCRCEVKGNRGDNI